jgi:hypothetical protein
VKKLAVVSLILAGLLPAVATRAQVFGQYVPADILPANSRLAGAYLELSENVVGALGQLRLSFMPNVDFGFQGGLERLDFGPSATKTVLQLGGDFRVGVMTAGAGRPVDVALGAALGVETSDKYHLLRFGPQVVASRRFSMSSSASMAPNAGAMLSFATRDIGSNHTTDFSLPLRIGAELRAIPGMHISAEIQLRLADDLLDTTAFTGGVNFPF